MSPHAAQDADLSTPPPMLLVLIVIWPFASDKSQWPHRHGVGFLSPNSAARDHLSPSHPPVLSPAHVRAGVRHGPWPMDHGSWRLLPPGRIALRFGFGLGFGFGGPVALWPWQSAVISIRKNRSAVMAKGTAQCAPSLAAGLSADILPKVVAMECPLGISSAGSSASPPLDTVACIDLAWPDMA